MGAMNTTRNIYFALRNLQEAPTASRHNGMEFRHYGWEKRYTDRTVVAIG